MYSFKLKNAIKQINIEYLAGVCKGKGFNSRYRSYIWLDSTLIMVAAVHRHYQSFHNSNNIHDYEISNLEKKRT